jgi:magnesium transporter
MPATTISSDQLHDSIRDYVRPADLIVQPDATIGDALAVARGLPATQVVLYCYVVDSEHRVVGIVPIRRLLTNPPEARIADVMIDDIVAIPAWATVLVAAEYFVNRRLLAFPVVEDNGRLVGVVDVGLFTDDLLALARQSFEGIFQIIGVHATAGRTPWTAFRDRFPWLLANIAGGLLCAALAGYYEGILQVAVVLALFIPVVLALAESVSIQSVTLTLQNLHGGAFNWQSFLRGLVKEFATASLLGLGCGLLVGGAAWVWKGDTRVAVVLGSAIGASMVTACLLGLALPTALHAAKADPKIAAGPIVLALTDLATLLFYFNVAGLLLR